jgi:uncharacterized protein YbcI
MLATVSRGIVQLLRETVGRGPARCRTNFAGPDMLIVSLSEGYLAAEHTLQNAGRSGDVTAIRSALQQVLEPRMRAIVEDAVGREVIAFMSASHNEPDLMVEIFALAPKDTT